eukprot:EC823963.1.p1 GENE.EC823963.1~~EC823963.1.p1  ORF type:complete len:147 (-),score=60.96 EC823963.1:40-480(-)
MNQIIYFIFIIVLIFTISAEPVNFEICDGPWDTFKLTNIDCKPITPHGGETVTVHMDGYSYDPKEVVGGRLETVITLKKIPMFQFKYDLCNVTTGGCPVKYGEWHGMLEQPVPKLAFPGVYTTTAKGYTTEKQFICVQFNITVVRP